MGKSIQPFARLSRSSPVPVDANLFDKLDLNNALGRGLKERKNERKEEETEVEPEVEARHNCSLVAATTIGIGRCDYCIAGC